MANWSDEEFNVIFKIYKRFLKENSVFRRALYIHTNHELKGNKKPISVNDVRESLMKAPDALSFIASAFSFCDWAKTKEGRCYWYFINIKWKTKCILENIGCVYTKEKIKDVIEIMKDFSNEFCFFDAEKKEKYEIEKKEVEKLKNILNKRV